MPAELKTFLWNGVRFLTPFLAILFVLELLLNQWDARANKGGYREALENPKNCDCIIIGSSHSENGIDPHYLDQLGWNAFNFSHPAAPPKYFLNWYSEIFSRYHQKPRLVLYQTDWFLFNDSFLYYVYEEDSRSLPFPVFSRHLFDSRFDRGRLLKHRFLLSIWYGRLPDFFRENAIAQKNFAHQYKGFWPVPSAVYHDFPRPIPLINPVQVEAFEKLIDQFQSEGVTVVFVQAPEHIPDRVSHPEALKILDQFAAAKRIPFLDYNRQKASAFNYDRQWYVDWGHLNGKGAAKFSPRLADDLSKILLSPTKSP